MPLPTFAKAEEIPEAFRDSYTEKDGVWVPDVEDVAALKNAHERQKAEARELKQKLKEIEEAGKAKAAGITDEQLAKLRADIAAEKAPLEDALTKAQQELRALKLDARLKTMLGEAGANPKRLDALHKLIGDRFDLNESGSIILKDKPAADLAKYLGETVAQEFPELYLSKQKGGAALPGSGGTGGSDDVVKLVTENPMRLLEMANTL